MKTATTNPIVAAIEPQRAATIAATRTAAEAQVAKIAADLEAAGFNIEDYAPRAKYNDGRYTGPAKDRFRAFINKLVSTKPAVGYSSTPDPIRYMDQAKIDRYIAECEKEADAAYTAFAEKLVGKIGDCDSAVLSGDHVWNKSTLTVTKGETVEKWTTRRILNHSVLGTPFNQWPTRKSK